MNEGDFKTNLIQKLKRIFPGMIVLHNNANFIRGIPDLTLLYKDKYAILEGKMTSSSSKRPNQDVWVDYFKNQGAYAAFISKSNEEEIINELRRYFKA